MKVGIQIPSFTWPGGPEAIGPTLARIVRQADDVGFDSIWVMDHFFQIRGVGKTEEPMLEGWTTLGFMAAHSQRARLGLMVGGVHYRYPGLWVKAATTLDVLSGGRAWLGIGAAWNEAEASGLGLGFPPLTERFERLEEALQICRQMWDPADDGPFHGKHYRLDRTLNVPQPLHRPRVLIGGGGERKTLRLVAKYADACNLFVGPQLPHKLEVLRGHCEAEGRPYEEIEKTAQMVLDLGDRGEKIDEFLATLAEIGKLGIQAVQGKVPRVWEPERIALFQREVIPAAAQL
jgi:F420-dependent oxidoreductase-like protein